MTEEETKAQKPANISRDGDVIAVRCGSVVCAWLTV